MKVYILVEGPTEEQFINRLLAAHLPVLRLIPVIVKTRTTGARPEKGGSLSYPQFRHQIELLLRDPTARLVSTMVDYQGMNRGFAGRAERNEKTARERAAALETAMKDDVNDVRYLPFVTMHEFEALLFSVPEVIAEVLRRPVLGKPLQEVRRSRKEYMISPEEINDSPTTSPSARIEQVCFDKLGSKHVFRKKVHGPTIAEKIGLAQLRANCPHFDGWVKKLENVASSSISLV